MATDAVTPWKEGVTGDGAVVRPPVDEAFAGYLAKLKITAATGSGSWKKGASDALGNVVTAWDAVVRPHILAQAAEIQRLTEQSKADDHTIDTQGEAIAELSARAADLLKALTDAALEFERRMDEHADSYNKHDFGDGQWLAYRNAAAWIHDASDAITGEGKQWAAAKGKTV